MKYLLIAAVSLLLSGCKIMDSLLFPDDSDLKNKAHAKVIVVSNIDPTLKRVSLYTNAEVNNHSIYISYDLDRVKRVFEYDAESSEYIYSKNYLPVGKNISISGYIFDMYNEKYACEDSKKFMPKTESNYIVNFSQYDKSCFIKIYEVKKTEKGQERYLVTN